MKIIKVIGTLDFGGAEKIWEVTARYYMKDKADIVFLSLGIGGNTERVIRELGYRVIIWDMDCKIPKWKLIWRLISFFKSERPDVVHTSGAEANFHGILAAWLSGVKVRIAEEYGIPQHSSTAKLIFRLVYNRAYKVIAVAGNVKDWLVESKEVEAKRVEVIFNPVEVSKFSMDKKEKMNLDDFVIISVCRLDPIKNLELLIRGVASLKKATTAKNVKLWLVGEGPSREDLKRLVIALGLENNVTFWGYQANPATYLQSASIFVLPSFSEGLPIAVGEAMLTGTPCVVTNVGGGPELVNHGESGWLLDPMDQVGFDQLLASIVNLPEEELNRVGLKGKEAAFQNFRPDHYMDRVWNLYDKALIHYSNTYGKN
jgi:glycosyltransferase involved in cell wall biosynthesis